MKVRFPAVLVLTALLAACNSQAQPATALPELPTQAPFQAAMQAEETVPEAAAAPTEAQVQTLPTPRPDLAATNPANVNLSAGKPSLVEFFAFW